MSDVIAPAAAAARPLVNVDDDDDVREAQPDGTGGTDGTPPLSR